MRGGERRVLEGTVSRGAYAHGVGCLLSVALFFLVCVAVALGSGDDLPQELVGSTPWFVGALAVSCGLAGLAYQKARMPLTVLRRDDGQAVIRIQDPSGVVELCGPFELRYGFFKNPIPGRAPSTTTLVLRIHAEGAPALVVSEEWGAIHGVPEGWDEGYPRPVGTPPAPEGQAPAARCYQVLAGSFMLELVAELERDPGAPPPPGGGG